MSTKSLDDSLSKEMTDLCQKLTHTGQKILDQKDMKKFENLCKKSDAAMDHAYNLLMGHLEKKHAEVRYGALLMCDQLFRGQSNFRGRMVEDLQTLMQLTMATSREHPLPPPKAGAKALRQRALKAISDWYHEFRVWHVQLESAYEFLRDCLNVDFKSIEQERTMEARRKLHLDKALQQRQQEKLSNTEKQMRDSFEEASTSVSALETCLSLLLPPPEDFFVAGLPHQQPDTAGAAPKGAETAFAEDCGTQEDANSAVNMREYGVVNPNHAVTFTFATTPSKLKVNKDNYSIVENARDFYKQITKQYLPQIKCWVKVLKTACAETAAATTAGTAGRQEAAEQLLKQAERVVGQYRQLGLHEHDGTQLDSSESDSDEEEMEEVRPKEGYEEEVKDVMLAEMLQKRAQQQQQQQASSSKSAGQLSAAAVAWPKPASSMPARKPMPRDITEWQDKQDLPMPHIVMGMQVDTHQVWLSASSLDAGEPVAPQLSSCAIQFDTHFEPVKWACRRLLPSGKLCPRRDRLKCPLHGTIVARDTQGQCVRPEDAEREARAEQQHAQQNPDWQEPKLLAQILKTTGIDLKMPEKGKRKKKAAEFPGLTDLKKKNDSPQSRLAKKIFKRSDMNRRLVSSLDDVDKKKTNQSDDLLFGDN